MKAIALCGAVLALVSSVPALAADEAPAKPVCSSGQYAVVRTSQIRPDGSLEGFKKAMADHIKWYADHGYDDDDFTWGQVLERDPATKKLMLSNDKVMTFHMSSSAVPPDQHDADWDEFVNEYKANSTVLNTTLLCMGG